MSIASALIMMLFPILERFIVLPFLPLGWDIPKSHFQFSADEHINTTNIELKFFFTQLHMSIFPNFPLPVSVRYAFQRITVHTTADIGIEQRNDRAIEQLHYFHPTYLSPGNPGLLPATLSCAALYFKFSRRYRCFCANWRSMPINTKRINVSID